MLPRKEFKRLVVPTDAPLPPKTRVKGAPRAARVPKYSYVVFYGDRLGPDGTVAIPIGIAIPKAKGLKDARVLADQVRRDAGLHTNATFIDRIVNAPSSFVKRYRYRARRTRGRRWR